MSAPGLDLGLPPLGYVAAGATLSADGRYRYRLWREWRGAATDENWDWLPDGQGGAAVDGSGQALGEPKACLFVMLNPSTADAAIDDPTIRRCVAFAKGWRYDRLEVVNLFAHRATNPRDLLALDHDDDPVGSDNQRHFERAFQRADLIVCAWGAHGGHLGQDETALGWMGDRPRVALGLTKDGHPRHPLYVTAGTALVRFRP